MSDPPLLTVSDLTKHFPLGGGLFSPPRAFVHAVQGVSFTLQAGETFGLVGESGCGKSTLGRLILRLIDPTFGKIRFRGRDITSLSRSEMRPLRGAMQIIFQDPYSSLDPRMRVVDIITEPMRGARRTDRRAAAAGLLEKVGLREGDLAKYPHEFSGGQRQRIGIARALCLNPALIVADEPVSALDVSIQAQVINLLADLKAEFQLSYLFISHDLSVVMHICDRIAVMYLGRIVETAPVDGFSETQKHPYARTLMAAVPEPDPAVRTELIAMEGDVPDPIHPPAGCAFHPRCPYAFSPCRETAPALVETTPERWVACHVNGGAGLD